MECLYQLKLRNVNDGSVNQIRHFIIKAGFYFRTSDGLLIQRYRCKTCRKTFSDETLNACRYQKKRNLNLLCLELLASGVSQRRSARILRINKKTLVRKFLFLGREAVLALREKRHLKNRSIRALQYDDIETFEHTKLKPLSIALAVEENTRVILGFRVASMPAKGPLFKKSIKKYGHREDERSLKRIEIFKEMRPNLLADSIIKTDKNPHYKNDILKYFPNQFHLAFKGKRSRHGGQGELKRGGFDPIFSLNHTAAMLRANINRLFRRTWCTTKKAVCLEYHMALYTIYHNYKLL